MFTLLHKGPWGTKLKTSIILLGEDGWVSLSMHTKQNKTKQKHLKIEITLTKNKFAGVFNIHTSCSHDPTDYWFSNILSALPTYVFTSILIKKCAH